MRVLQKATKDWLEVLCRAWEAKGVGVEPEVLKKGFAMLRGSLRACGRGGVRSTHTNGTFTFLSEIS